MSNDQCSNKDHHQKKHKKNIYSKCGKDHCGKCILGMGLCCRCGKPRHFANDCKENSFANDNEHKKTTQARVYFMTRKEVKDASTVVTGIYIPI